MYGNYKRVGIMGGTFDPIHNGHLAAAEAARRNFGLERVFFIPTGKAPHKNNMFITPGAQRYGMTSLACASNKYFDVLSIEIERAGPSYTSDTLVELRRRFGHQAIIYFIAGADAMSEMNMWKAPERIYKNCSVIAVSRPGLNTELLNQQITTAGERFGAKIHVLHMPALDISSSDIRKRTQIEQPIKYLLPEIVEQYINKQRLYRNDFYDMEEAERRISSALSDKRWHHTIGVVKEAVRLSEIYGVNRRKAYITAIFHDYAKEMPSKEKLRYCDERGISLDNVMRSHIDLAHGLISAEKAKTEFNIDDPEILNAIRFHTTGCEQMSLLDKILLAADYMEPNRKGFKGIEEIRKVLSVDLDKASALTLKMKIAYTISKKQAVHPLSIKALEDIKQTKQKE